MSANYLAKWPVPRLLLDSLRQRFLSEIANPAELALYHPDDIKRVKEDDWFIARYLLHQNKDIDEALKMMKDSLKFRKDYEVNTLKKSDLPADYFKVRAVITYNKDKKDHPIVVIRGKTHIKNDEMRRIQQQYFLYWLEIAARQSNWGVVSVLFDCTDAGVSNMDMDMIRFILNVFKRYYPWGLSVFLVYNMPWIMSAFWKIIKALIPEQYVGKITFVDSKSIKNYIDENQLPISLGGKCPKLYEPKEGVEDDFDYESAVVQPTAVY